MLFYSKKSLLLVIASLTSITLLKAQETITDVAEIDGYSLQLNKQELFEITEGCDLVLNRITLKNEEKTIYEKTICATTLEDIVIINKGYLTIVEYYGAPVGWSQYYIFDFCKQRLILTKRLDEGVKVEWINFINPTVEFSKKYVEKMIVLK